MLQLTAPAECSAATRVFLFCLSTPESRKWFFYSQFQKPTAEPTLPIARIVQRAFESISLEHIVEGDGSEGLRAPYFFLYR